MLNELITWVLNTYLGKYLEDFNPAQLSIALVSGEVELENVPIRRDALRSFGIPVEALAGSIGKIKLQIPVRQFRTSPWIIAIEKVYGVFGPKDLSSWDSEKEKDAEFAYKTSVLDAKEANWRVDNGRHSESYYSLSYSNWINYGASLATNIIENLELKIKDIHLRYEDTVNMHVAGIRVSSISAQSCDAKWTPGAKNPDLHRVSYKLLELKDFYFYWDNLDTNNTCKELSSKDLLVKMNDICKIEDHKFLTNSINASVKFKRERCKQSLRSKHRPRISCEVSLDQVKLVLNDVQYIEIMQCISSLQRISEIRSFKVSRPTMSVLSDAKQWWKYAAQCYGFTYHTVEEKWAMARENIRYIYIYKRLLINPSENMSKEDKQFKINFEKNRSLDDLKFLRDICFNYISHRGINSTTRSVLQGKNILYHWFPNWLGWYGISENVASETGMDNNETYKHIEDDILSALKESIENETFSKRDAVFGNFRFALSDVKISLVSSKSGIDATMLDMNLKNLFCFVEIKPKLTSYRVGISLGSIHLNDKMTESTEFPFLVKPQKKENTNHKSLYNEFLNFFSKKISDNESDEPWFQLQYERNPPEHKSDYRLIIKSKSLDIVYNETAFKWLASFFIQPLTDLKTVRNQLVERKSRLKFFKNWKSVLVGQKKESRKKWSFEIDISAPRIICVDNFKEKNTSIVLIDFGRFQLFKNERSTEEMRMDVEANENDSDEELFMTPCSTPPGSHTSKSVSPDTNIANSTAGNDTFLSRFVINSDTGLENELHSEIYDKYIINLTDMQVLVCKNKEIGYACAKSSSNYHLLDKFNINLHLERRIISTSDPDYPAFTLFGNLNRIVAHINEQKISDCIRILNPLTLELSGTTKYSKIDERNYEDNNDRFEDSDTTIFQFVIGQIILEIQSRQKSIAEMQVIGAKTGITKKTGDVNINMSVHGFLLVDAIQSFGPDFELLVASHRHVEMDSISGSLKQSEPCSPTSPGSPDPNAYQRCASPQIINKALNELQAGMESDSKVGDALITIDFHVIHDPGDLEATQIANITFNNLDVIANQETVVELLGFGKRIVDNFKHLKSVTKTNNQAFDYFSNTEQVEIRQKKYEISFDFHRLNILVLRSIRIEKNNTGRKVGTLTMSEAKIHATLGKDVSVSGVLGGIQIIDITPEGFNHQRIFSVGKDPLTDQPSLQAKCVLHSLANEMYGNDFEQRDCFHMNALTFKINKAESSEVEVKIRMASVWYTHCPRFIEEIYLCVKEFRQYFKNFVKSLRSKASHMAKGLVHHISGHKETVSRFAELSLDVVFSSPVLVLPKSCESTEVLVANLGKITVRNKQEKSSSDTANIRKENECMWNERITYFIDVRNINLFSLHAPKRKVGDSKFCQRANEMYSCQKDAIPILHDTALLFQCVYEFNDSTKGSGEIGNALVVDGSVTQNLQVSLSRRQYEQLMECLNYATNVSLTKEACPTTKVDDTLPGNKNVNDSPKPFYFEMIDTQFSVPILRLDLRNEHNMSLICLTLKEFSFKNKILHNKQKETQILLRSVLMEDLKCPLTSKFRNMVNSSSDILAPSNSFKNHISSSCPDLSRSYNQGNSNIHGSTPSNLDTLLKNRSTTKANDIHDLKDIEGLHFLRNRTTGNLVIYRSLIREKKHSSIDFNCLNLIISIEKWFMVFDFFGLISNQSDRETETSKQSTDNKICELSHELHVTIRSLDLILVRNDFELAKANVSNVQVHISRDDFLQTVRGSLGSISIYDLTSYGHLYQEKFSTSGMEALSFKYTRKNDNSMQSKKQSRSLEKDAVLAIDMSSVKYVHTKRFIIELQLFVKELLQLQSPVMNHIKSADEKNRNSNFQKIGLEVHADSPIILFPVSHNSNHLLIADLGKFSLKNIFAYYNHTLSEERQSTDTSFHEIIDVMNIDLLNINLLTGKREINNLACTPGEDSGILHVGNFCIVNLGKTIFKEKCHLKIHVIRNTEPDVSHNIPDIKIKGTLSELNGLINVQQYKLIRGFLKYNLGETIDDVYFNYQMNLNESLEILSSITKVNVPQAVDVWNTLSINFILDNVTIYLAEPCELQGYGGYGSSGANLACIKFIKSNLEIDLYSDGSQDIDLISSEILLMDARESSRKSTPNNCFKHILKPSTGGGSTKSTVQAEIHSRSRGDVSKYTILLNNMRIMALLDYLESLKNFLNEEPLMSSLVIEKKSASRHGATQSQQPFATTFTEDTDVKNEFVLNITNSEIVFVENSAQSDSNAIILKSTTVFSYKPNSSVVPVSVDINHLEIFSCILGSENESSLSIIDPFTLNMELRNNCFHIFIPNQVFLRVSYNDVMLFSRMMQSIPKQTQHSAPPQSSVIDDFEKIAPLVAMGFKPDECWSAMHINNNNLNEAAIWMSQHKQKSTTSRVNISNISFNASSVSICIIDDCLDADVPLLEFSLCQLNIDQNFNLSTEANQAVCYDGKVESIISSNYYNRRLSGWEPIIEAWECCGNWKFLRSKFENLKTLHVNVFSKQTLKFNVTSTLIELCEIVRKNWTEDFVRSSTSDSLNVNSKQRHPFVPFALKNLTGEPLLFKIFYSHVGGITRTEINNKQDLLCNWISAQHNEIVPFDFGPQSKWRHLDSHKLNMHQILVQIHGWTLIGPISIDKVGTFFRYANLDMQYNKKTRIVFEISLCGSAQKLITVRSALNVVNNTEKPFLLHMKLKGDYENAVMALDPLQKITIPLRYLDSTLFIKPYLESDLQNKVYELVRNDDNGSFRKYLSEQVDETAFCTHSISWLNCVLQESIQDVHSCFLPNKVPFHVISDIRKDKYPMRDVGALPGHTINILPPLKLKNLLCCDVLYKISGHIEGRIDATKQIEIYSIDITDSFSLSLSLDNYRLSGQIKIPLGHTGIVETKFKLIDILNRELFLRVSIQSFQGKGMDIFIGAPIWIINKTGLPLIFRQEGTNQPSSGQFDDHEYAREVSPLIFSFSDQEGAPLLEFRLGKSYGNNNPWCKSFGINRETTFRELKAENSKINYVIGVNIHRGKGLYFSTTFVTLTPRFQLYNRTTKKLHFMQKCDVKNSMETAPENLISALPGSNFPFHWSNCDQEPLLCVRVAEEEYCRWSHGLPVNESKSLYINLRTEVGEMIFLRLEVILHGGTYILHFTDAHTLPPPIRFDNFSEVSIHFSQMGVEPYWRTNVKPFSSLAYVLDDSLGLHVLRIEAPGGNSIEYPLQKSGIAKNITYANFIYIAFKETFRSAISQCDDNVSIETQQLVLGVKDKRVIITRKCTGDRSQLWLMNSYGQLEHEGSSPPSEYLKSAQSSPRLVLDLEKPPNPSEYTKLVVRPQNNQRATTQTWRFEKGRLMCHANMCVQQILYEIQRVGPSEVHVSIKVHKISSTGVGAANGIYGLKPGRHAVLGKIESEDRAIKDDSVPFEQSIEIQKFRPGSGHLEVLSKMDGPIKSIQIRDVKSNPDEIVLMADPLWNHASVFNKVQIKKQANPALSEVLIKLALAKGVGLSMVSRSPCEEIAYLTFEDIALDIILLPFTKSLDLKIGNFQVDNQLLETACPIIFYMTKTNTEGVAKDAIMVKAKILQSPNENAVILEHLSINLNPCAVLLEERVVLKTALFLGYGHVSNKLDQRTESHTYRIDDYPFSKNAKRYYFENLTIGATQVRLTVLTAPKLSPELFELKKSLGLTLIKFEDALIEFDKFSDRHHFETLDIYIKALKVHYVNQLKWHAASILGSVDFLGNPLGFANDLSEGVSGLIFEGSVKSLVRNVTHGISNSTAKLTETISDSLGRVVLDEHDNETRHRILEVSYPTTGGHLAAGLKGLGFGLLGGVTSIVRHTYVGAQSDGFPGFLSGLGKGLVGTVTKPLIGVLDLASETASAVRETSRGSHHCLPNRKRLPRCVTGALGGLLPSYSYRHSKGQQYLYIINRRNFSEKLIYYEPNLCNDREAKLRLLVSTDFVRIFSRCEEDPAIIIECHLSEVLSCHPLTTNINTSHSSKSTSSYYIEISTNLPKVTRPRVRCQNEEVAERASRCINYAKSIFDEREHCLANI